MENVDDTLSIKKHGGIKEVSPEVKGQRRGVWGVEGNGGEGGEGVVVVNKGNRNGNNNQSENLIKKSIWIQMELCDGGRRGRRRDGRK